MSKHVKYRIYQDLFCYTVHVACILVTYLNICCLHVDVRRGAQYSTFNSFPFSPLGGCWGTCVAFDYRKQLAMFKSNGFPAVAPSGALDDMLAEHKAW